MSLLLFNSNPDTTPNLTSCKSGDSFWSDARAKLTAKKNWHSCEIDARAKYDLSHKSDLFHKHGLSPRNWLKLHLRFLSYHLDSTEHLWSDGQSNMIKTLLSNFNSTVKGKISKNSFDLFFFCSLKSV